MRSPSQVRQQLKQLKFRARKKVLSDNFKVSPCRCRYNKEVKLSERLSVGTCTYREDGWEVVVCDESSASGRKQARNCSKFCPLKTSDDIKEEFEALIRDAENSGDVGPVAYFYPDIAALLWVLAPWEQDSDSLCSEVTQKCFVGEETTHSSLREGPLSSPPEESAPEPDEGSLVASQAPLPSIGSVESFHLHWVVVLWWRFVFWLRARTSH